MTETANWVQYWATSRNLEPSQYSELTPYLYQPPPSPNLSNYLNEAIRISLVKEVKSQTFWLGWNYQLNYKLPLMAGNIAMSWVTPNWLNDSKKQVSYLCQSTVQLSGRYTIQTSQIISEQDLGDIHPSDLAKFTTKTSNPLLETQTSFLGKNSDGWSSAGCMTWRSFDDLQPEMKALKIGDILTLKLGFKAHASKFDSQPVARSKNSKNPIQYLLVDVATSPNESTQTISKEIIQSSNNSPGELQQSGADTSTSSVDVLIEPPQQQSNQNSTIPDVVKQDSNNSTASYKNSNSISEPTSPNNLQQPNNKISTSSEDNNKDFMNQTASNQSSAQSEDATQSNQLKQPISQSSALSDDVFSSFGRQSEESNSYSNVQSTEVLGGFTSQMNGEVKVSQEAVSAKESDQTAINSLEDIFKSNSQQSNKNPIAKSEDQSQQSTYLSFVDWFISLLNQNSQIPIVQPKGGQ